VNPFVSPDTEAPREESATAPANQLHVPRKYGLLSRLRSYLFIDPLVFLYTFVFGAASLPFDFFDRSGRILHGFARLWSKCILKTIFSPVTVTGLEKIDISRPRIYAANHGSALDIPILYANLPFQFRIIHKRELLFYPIVGWHLKRSGQICVDQQNPASSIRTVRSGLKALKNGMPLVIFPEGARTPDGEIKPFMQGAFFFAIKAQVEIVPIALVGTFELLPMDTYHIKCRPVEMRVGDPITTDGLTVDDMDALSARVQKALESLYEGPAPTA